MKVQIESSWNHILQDTFNKPYFEQIVNNLKAEKNAGKTIFPPGSLLFNAFNTTPFDAVKVVVLGQDPYHKIGQAMGLSFSVSKGIPVPPSLKNIYKELNTDMGCPIPGHGDLTAWAEQGVFLLNAILTVEASKAGSHRNLGWQQFTDTVIQCLSDQKEHLVFMLWGNFARAKKSLIDSSKHLILEAAHPSPLARGAYFGSKHFSQCNTYLKNHNKASIKWTLD